MDYCRKISKHFSSSTVEEQNLLLPSTRPTWLTSLYTELGAPATERQEERPQPPYLCIPIKTELNCKYFNVETETKRVSWVCGDSTGNELILLSAEIV